jgi:hypothetical protein
MAHIQAIHDSIASGAMPFYPRYSLEAEAYAVE